MPSGHLAELCAGWVCAVFVRPSAQGSNRKEAVALCACAHKIPILPIRGPIAPHNGLNPGLVRTSCAARAAARPAVRAPLGGLLIRPEVPDGRPGAQEGGSGAGHILRLLPTSVACTTPAFWGADIACAMC